MKRINEVYKPSKIKFIGKTKIISTKDGNFVIKPKNKNIKELYDYLNIRDFNSYPQITDEVAEGYVYEHLKDIKVPINQKASDMANLLSLLHNKTAYFKPITADYIKKVHEDISNNIDYLEDYYTKLTENIKSETLMSPSNYLLIRNSTKIFSIFSFARSEIERWLREVQDQTKIRVVYCHNNLTIDHYIKNYDDYFISWDNYLIDSPVLDLINLYQKDYNKYDFSNFFEIYESRFPLNEAEKKLFFIVISLPSEIKLGSDEFSNTTVVNNLLTYIYKTENLIRPYYAPQDPKEQS